MQHSSGRHRRRRRRRRASPVRCLLGCICLAIVLSIYTALWATREQETDDAPLRLRGGRERIAFLFLVRDQIPTAPIWQAFFKDADARGAKGLYRLYTHPRPGFTYAPGSLFYGTEVANRTRVKWGAVTVARGTMRLMQAALRDPRTARSLLMSEADVPLHPFWCVHAYLFSTPKSFAASWTTHDRKKLYDFGDAEALYRSRWRKGHQWVSLTRNHMLLLDAAQYERFRRAHADSSVAADFRRESSAAHATLRDHGNDRVARRWRGPAADADDTHHCFADEHFAATTLAVRGVEREVIPVCVPRPVETTLLHAFDAPKLNRHRLHAGLDHLHRLRRLPARPAVTSRARYQPADEARLARHDLQAGGHRRGLARRRARAVSLFERPRAAQIR